VTRVLRARPAAWGRVHDGGHISRDLPQLTGGVTPAIRRIAAAAPPGQLPAAYPGREARQPGCLYRVTACGQPRNLGWARVGALPHAPARPRPYLTQLPRRRLPAARLAAT
jgi:hypothetical protein